MKQYLDLMQELLDSGNLKGDRTGTGTLSKFGHQMRFDLNEGFPLITTRKIFMTGVTDELLWIVKGSTNIYDLPERTRHWWAPWAGKDGELGPIYGRMMRETNFMDDDECVHVVDQLSEVTNSIKTNPESRRHMINLWHTPAMSIAKLPCCHGSIIQFYVFDGKLSCSMYQRSCDVMIGLPANIASYALLTHMIAQQCDLQLGELIWQGGDVHLYNNHLEQARLQLTRQPKALPRLVIKRRPDSIFDYEYEDFELVGYDPHPAIKAEVSI